jgi:hypothetical protein
MRSWPAYVRAGGVCVVGIVALTALLEFLAPDLSYGLQDRVREWLTPRAGKRFRIRVGAMTGSAYRVAETLSRHLAARSGYELELVGDAVPGSGIQKLRRGDDAVDLAMASSADEVGGVEGVVGLARLDSQFFFVVVPNDSAVREIRDLAGPVNPGAREGDARPTLGERVLDYYGLIGSSADGGAGRVSVVRPEKGNVADFEAGRMVAATRTPDLSSAEILIREADDLLSRAELDGAAELLDVEGLRSLRSLHQVCSRALEHRRAALGHADLTRLLATPVVRDQPVAAPPVSAAAGEPSLSGSRDV